MGPNTVTPERIAKAVSMVSQRDGKMTRRQIALEMHVSGGVASMIVTSAIEMNLIKSTAFRRGQQGLLSIVRDEKSEFDKNWFEGWAGAPRLR